MRKYLFLGSAIFIAIAITRVAEAADPATFAGEYADKKFLSGQGVFQMSIEQKGTTATVWFSTSYNDGRGCSPEAEGPGKVSGKGTLDFTFKDGEGDSGTGTISKSGDGIVVSIKPSHVADARCIVYYKQSIHLKRAAKK